MTHTPTPSPDPARCPECGGGWWEPHRTGCSEPRFPAPSAPGEGTERPDTDALRAEADDLDYIALSAGWVGQDWSTEVDRAATTMRRAADWIDAQPPVPLSPAPQADGWTAAELLDDLNDRTERAMVELERTAAHGSGEWHHRTLGKLAGLALVADWLRGYDCYARPTLPAETDEP